ncbi:DNA-J related domain-containing protein [Halopseudomonas sp.]|uniref:DNA-J related domain-containing protein n=1 Tax=Halopseudomonas sp. TaxID=2901191 RepID=UPI00311E1C00
MIELQPDMLLPAGFDEALQKLLQVNPQGLGEYALLRALAERFPESLFAEPQAMRDPLTLFRLHFLLFHQLYRLADQVGRQGLTLNIHALKIQLVPRIPGTEALQVDDPLRRYYLDWDHWRDTNRDDVERLIDSFWRGRASVSEPEVSAALAVLELEEGADAAACRRQYRRLLSQHHPDRGGSTARAQEINQAMLILQRYYGKS